MYGVCSSVAPQYEEFLRATAISIGEMSVPPMSGVKCVSHSSLNRPMLM